MAVTIEPTVTVEETRRRAAQLQQSVDVLFGRYQTAEDRAQQEAAAIPILQDTVRVLQLTESALNTLLGKVSEESLRSIESTITYGLRVVFDDHPLTFRFRANVARGGQVLEPVLGLGDVEQPILDAFGGGPAELVAFLLRLIVCHRLGLYPLILMDETFSMVSVEYLPNLAKLLRELAEKMGYTFVLVTQERAILPGAADKAYEIVESSQGATFKEVTS